MSNRGQVELLECGGRVIGRPERLSFKVYGTPAPQGSKRHVGNGVMIESSKRVKPWRQDVKHAALDAITERQWQQPAGSVWVAITFRLQRPKGHYGTGRNAGVVKDSAPVRPAVKPDIDKLVRSTLDALTESGAVRDDAQVVSLSTSKFYADGDMPGATVEVWSHE
jgi:crossover junction endodeoxyribonuclease RusA